MEPCGVVVVEDPGCGAPGSCPAGIAALEQVANRPILHHVLDVLASAGVDQVIVASSTERAGDVRDSLVGRGTPDGVRLRYLEQLAPLDLPGAMRLAAPLVGQAPCVVHVASGLLGQSLEPFLDRLRRDSPDAVLIVHQGPAQHGHLNSATREMLHIAEFDPRRASLGVAGVSLFGPGGLAHAAAAEWWTSSGVDLTLVADRIAAAGGTFQVRLADAWQGSTGSPLDLLELNRIILDRLVSDHRRQHKDGNRVEGRVAIHHTASVQASVIIGPTVIGAGASVADSYVGPYTAIGPGARIEGAEIERSIISAGATITHIGCRVAGSVIGRDARVFRDFSLPRALRLCVGDGAEVALS